MRVLVACEYSGRTREAFRARGYDAWSCDLLPSEDDSPHHIQGDVRGVLNQGWDLLIAHPDCTYLTCSAEWAYTDGPYHQKVKPETLVGAARREAREQALEFVRLLMNAPIKHKAIENPRGAISTRIRPASQYIQPYEYGHNASKITGLWLENLPLLTPTQYIAPRLICKVCKGTSFYHAGFAVGCRCCGAEPGLLLPRWGNQTDSGQNKLTPGPDRWKERARTYQGWSNAMADQWGRYIDAMLKARASKEGE